MSCKVFCEVDVLSFIIISSDIGYYGSGVFNMRGNGQGTGGFTVVFRNIVVEDTRPTMASFKLQIEYWKDPENHSRRGPGNLYGMLFKTSPLQLTVYWIQRKNLKCCGGRRMVTYLTWCLTMFGLEMSWWIVLTISSTINMSLID